MITESSVLVPRFLDVFQGFFVKDIKEFLSERRIEVHLEKKADHKALCNSCGECLGHYHDCYKRVAKHLKLFQFNVTVHFFIDKRHCENCKKDFGKRKAFYGPLNTTPSASISQFY